MASTTIAPLDKVTCGTCLREGSWAVRLSVVVFGLGNLLNRQFIKGLLFLLFEIGLLRFLVTDGVYNLSKFITLGDVEQQKVWNEAKQIFEYVDGDRSLVILLYGIITLALIGGFLLLMRMSLRSAYVTEQKALRGKVPTFKEDVKELLDGRLHITLLSLPILGITAFTILPLIFMISMAFTDYSALNDKLVLFDWVGLDNFKRIITLGNSLSKTFWPVLGWTLVWAVTATITTYIVGMLLAIYINQDRVHGKGFWRFCFVLTVAVPHFVTLLIISQMLQPEGAVNILLRSLGILKAGESLPFFTNTNWSRTTVILTNIWVGAPYTMLQVTGILQNIPKELYESARIDGASPFVTFRKITLPYMLFVTTPALITTFAGNVNNFNVIFLTSKGLPRAVGSTAGDTDLLVTWLYKLTIENQYFDVGAVIGILTFVCLAVISLTTFRLSGSYKNEEGFR